MSKGVFTNTEDKDNRSFVNVSCEDFPLTGTAESPRKRAFSSLSGSIVARLFNPEDLSHLYSTRAQISAAMTEAKDVIASVTLTRPRENNGLHNRETASPDPTSGDRES